MGCVSFTQRYFSDGRITKKGFKEAVAGARRELLNIEANYKTIGWESAVGSSGTIRAAEQAMIENGWSEEGMTADGLAKLVEFTLQFETINDVNISGVKPERRQVFIGGLAILTAVFETFALKRMVYSDGALREGALWDLVGRSSHENVRERTIDSLQERFYVDTNQATRVKVMAAALFSQVKADWSLNKEASNSLAWAAELHEVGLSIAHSSFHKHGAYLLQHSDLLGFTRQGQTMLAVLVRNHRRKIQKDEVSVLSKRQQTTALQLIRLLRIAVVLNHSRDAHEVPTPVLTVNGDDLMLAMPEGWLEEHPLTATDLAAEVDYQNAAGMKLSVA